jgi:hypothetical protein
VRKAALSPNYRFSASQPKSGFGKHTKWLPKLRPIAAVHLTSVMLRCGPSDRTFAATAKNLDGRTHSLRTNLPFAANARRFILKPPVNTDSSEKRLNNLGGRNLKLWAAFLE